MSFRSLAFLLAAPLLGADYYIATTGNDSDPCSLAQPCLTLPHVQGLVQTDIAGGLAADEHVYLRGGTYRLASTLSFTSSDSGNNGFNVIWTGYQNEAALISGGDAVSGWALFSGSIFRTNTSLPANFRQIYVNGTHADRAHGANQPGGWTITSGGYTAPNGTVAGYANPTDIEMVNLGNWWTERCKIATAVSTTITMANPCWANRSTTSGGLRLLWVENAFELIASGTWYLNRATGYLYYWPPGGTMSGVTVTVPVLEQLLTATGVSNIQFINLTWEYAGWTAPDVGSAGFPGVQSGYFYSNPPCAAPLANCMTDEAAAVYFTSSSNVVISHNTFTHNGARALQFDVASHDIQILANYFPDNAGGAIQIGGISDYANSNTATQTHAITIRDNNIPTNASFMYFDGSGIFATYVAGLTVDHNSLDFADWSAIAVGWGWATGTSYGNQNTVTNNSITNYCPVFSDCGAIYTNNIQSQASAYATGFTATGNYFDSTNTNSGCQYADEQSNYETWTGNTCQYTTLGHVHDADHIIMTGSNTVGTGVTNSGSTNITTSNTAISAHTFPTFSMYTLCSSGVTPGVTPGPYSSTSPTYVPCSPTHPTSTGWNTWRRIPSSGLLASWPLAEGSGPLGYEWSGTGYLEAWNGTAASTFGYYSAGGRTTYAGNFDGSTNWLSYPGTAGLQFGTGDFSICAWAKLTNITGNEFLLDKDNGGAVHGWGFYSASTTGLVSFVQQGVAGGAGSSGWSAGTWGHACVSQASAVMTFYFNGVSGGAHTFTSPNYNSSDQVGIGAATAGGNKLTGLMSDVLIYSRALSALEVKAIYEATK